MKTKIELDLNVTMGSVSHDGAGCQGYLPEGTRHDDVIRVFGEPQLGKSLDGKIKAEWIGRINGLVFTIYDYKSEVDLEKNTDWHIGGKKKIVEVLVNAYFNFQKNLDPNR